MNKNTKQKQGFKPKSKLNVLKNIFVCVLAVSTVTFGSLFVWKYLEVTPTPDPVNPPTPDPTPDPKAVYHWVGFETYGGTHIQPIEVQHNSLLDKNEILVPTKTGYNFVTWCIDEELTTPFDFHAPIQDDLLLFARYNDFDAALTIDITVKITMLF